MSSVAEAPSESWEELPAVTEPWPLVLSKYGRERQQPFERRVRAVALVLVDVVVLLARDLARLLVDDAAHDLHRRQLFLEEAVLLGARGALLAHQSEYSSCAWRVTL